MKRSKFVLWAFCCLSLCVACDMQDGGNPNNNLNDNANQNTNENPDDDVDGDGIADSDDNCPIVANPMQGDLDDDGVGNSCDNCTDQPNPGQIDSDADGTGDACEGDENDNADNVNANDNEGDDNQNDNSNNDNDNDNGGIFNTEVPDGFPSAAVVSFDANDRIEIDDQTNIASEILVYDLGSLNLGDRIDVLCEPVSGSTLDPMIALFDVDGSRVFWNDDVNAAISDFDAGFEDLIRHNSEHYFLALTSTSFINTAGPFRCIIERQVGVGLAPILGHTVVLRWMPAEDVDVSGIAFGDLPAFDGGSIDPDLADDTATLMGRIEQVVEQDFADFDLTVLTSDDATPTAAFSTVFFGVSTAQSIFGIADDIDFYNADKNDNAIIILDAFNGLSSTPQVIGQAVGNVVSHEIGHTLGLMHTTDVTELMDTTGSASTLLEDQSFATAEVFDFPIGRQDAPLLLAETIGQAARSQGHISDGRWRCGTCGATLKLVTGK